MIPEGVTEPAAPSAGANYCWSCGAKIPAGKTICDACNKGPE